MMKRTRQTTPVISSRRITFYPAIFNQATLIDYDMTPYGKVPFWETMHTGSFAKFLTTPDEVVGNVNHVGESYARRTSGELLLAEDEHGLFATCYLPMSRIGNKVIEAANLGLLNGASFEGPAIREIWNTGEKLTRDVYEAGLVNVCVAIGENPAYAGTSAALLRTKQHEVTDFLLRLRILKARS